MKSLPFLWEVGCEEIPADWLKDTLSQLKEKFEAELRTASLEAQADVYGTPRRLVLDARILERQPDRRDEVVGPPSSVGRTREGEWSPAALGFAKKNAIPLDRLKLLRTDKGEYVGFVREVKGRPTRELLPGGMAAALRGLTFPKFMNWDAEIPDGHGAFPFGRPIRWMVAVFGGKVVPFEIRSTAGGSPVRSSNKTYGHRFLAPSGKKPGAPIVVSSFQELARELKRHYVLLDPKARRARLEKELQNIEKKARAHRAPGLNPDTVADLVEWPGAVLGSYPDEFTALPDEVRHTVLIHHQKYFPLEGKAAFIAVTNMASDPKGNIRRGSERVVVARFRDAHFFWKEDLKRPLADRARDLSRVQFHQKLGTYQEKVERLVRLAGWLADLTHVPPETVRRAAELSKCDLTTEMVREFTELQGIVGGLYAREEGQPEEVWQAVYSHYRPLTLEDEGDFPEGAVGVLVSLADKLDTLTGMFGAGLMPTGSKDPFGLRRAALGVLRLLLQSEERTGLRLELSLDQLITEAQKLHDKTAPVELSEFLTERLRFVLERSYRYDEVNAVLRTGALSRPPADLAERLKAVATLRGSSDFEALSTAFKRVRNILTDQKPGAVDAQAFSEPAEQALWSAFKAVEPVAGEHISEGRYEEALRALSTLRSAVDLFFDKVLVMSPDARLKDNRLALLSALQQLFTQVVDLSEIVPGAPS